VVSERVCATDISEVASPKLEINIPSNTPGTAIIALDRGGAGRREGRL
jgi:hypothetical protein